MGSILVVEFKILLAWMIHVLRAEDDKPIQALLANRLNETFDIGIGVGIAICILDGLHLSLFQDLHKLLGELSVAIMLHLTDWYLQLLSLPDE